MTICKNVKRFYLRHKWQPSPSEQTNYLAYLLGDVLQAEGEYLPSGSEDELTNVISDHQRAKTAKLRLFELFQVHVCERLRERQLRVTFQTHASLKVSPQWALILTHVM